MATATERTDIDLSHWVPGVRYFAASDGRHMVIDADTTEYPDGPTRYIRRKTAVFYCGENGTVTDMTPDHLYPPGTTAEDALAELGYAIGPPA